MLCIFLRPYTEDSVFVKSLSLTIMGRLSEINGVVCVPVCVCVGLCVSGCVF